MSIISFLIKKQFKNYLVSLKKNPAKLIGYLFILLFIVFIFVVSMLGKNEGTQKARDVGELGTFIAAFFMFIFWASLYTGLERGATFFKMPDVNLLFTAPISSKKVLLYGVIKQMGLNLFISVFIVYQVPTLTRLYHITGLDCTVIFGGYIILLIATQFCSMGLYMFANGNIKRKKFIKAGLNGVLLIIGALFIYKITLGESFFIALMEALKVLNYVPFVGWIKGIIYTTIIAEVYLALGYTLLTIAGFATILGLILKSNVDYYEDVLTATEYIAEVTQAMQKGNNMLDSQTKLKGEKIKSFGLKKGNGASVLFYKQLLESRRSGKFGISIITIIQVVTAFGGTYFLKNIEEMDGYILVLIILGFMTYMQILLTGTQRWLSELRVHYIYMIPKKGIQKMIFASLEGILKAGLEGFLMFIPIGILLGINPLFILLCILTKVGFQILFTSLNILFQRVFGVIGNTGMMMLLFFLVAVLCAAPGIILGVIAGISTYETVSALYNYSIVLVVILAYNILVTFIISLFSNQIFTQMELNSKS